MTFEQLHLSPTMKRRAQELLEFCPSVQFISGRRDLQQQAHAMACNVVVNRHYIFEEYRNAAVLQTAVDLNPEAKTVSELEDVIHDAMVRMSTAELGKISDHFNGDAVDMQHMEVKHGKLWVPTEEGQAVIDWIRKCPETKYFTTREAKLVRWHWSVKASAEV